MASRASRIKRIGSSTTDSDPGLLKEMPSQKPTRRIIVPIVVLMLVLGITFGMVCHHHADCSAATCTLCHLVVVPIATGVQAWWVPAPLGTVLEAVYTEPVAGSVSRLPARAPPA